MKEIAGQNADADLDQGDRDANSNRDHGRDQGQTNPKRSSQPDIHRHLIVYGSGGDKTKTPTTTRSHDRGYQSQNYETVGWANPIAKLSSLQKDA